MVVLETAALLGGPYAQGAPALKMVQKRYIGLHQWLGPLRTKDLKEHIVSGLLFSYFVYYFRGCAPPNKENAHFSKNDSSKEKLLKSSNLLFISVN